MAKSQAQLTTRYIVDYDEDASFEECNGKPRPLSESEYRGNEYQACPLHPRAGTKVIDMGGNGRPQVQGCNVCGNTNYEDIPYEEYLAYYGNPDRHIYVYIRRQDQCPCCDTWRDGGSVYGVDMMDDNPEASYIGTFHAPDELPGYLGELARELDPPVEKRKK